MPPASEGYVTPYSKNLIRASVHSPAGGTPFRVLVNEGNDRGSDLRKRGVKGGKE